MKDVKGKPLISRVVGLAWTRLEHGRLGRGSREGSEGKSEVESHRNLRRPTQWWHHI